MKAVKAVLKWLLIVILIIVLAAAALIVYLTVTEYTPVDTEKVEYPAGDRTLSAGDGLSILSWNIGYSGLGKNEQFLMDGGKMSWPSEDSVKGYLSGIMDALAENDADVYFLQEVDKDSARTYGIDERESVSSALGLGYAFAPNFVCRFVPLPLPVPGRVESGLATYTDLSVTDAERIQLPVPFKWPVRTANLKRCLLVERVQLDGTDKELVIVNLHLEAYDDGEGKLAQTQKMMDILTEEYAKGNYVIAGGDWNQTFPGIDESVVPVLDSSSWMPGVLDAGSLPEGWRYAADGSAPSCRLLNMPYTDDPAVMQYYIIDGFLLSPNVQLVSIKTLDYGFSYSDHQPVLMNVKLVK